MGDAYLEIDDDKDNHDGGNEVGEVGCIASVKSLLKSNQLIVLGDQEMEESNNCTFEFISCFTLNFEWAE